MSCQVEATFHVVHMTEEVNARWSIDTYIDMEMLTRCYPYIDRSYYSKEKNYLTRLLWDAPEVQKIIRGLIVGDVLCALRKTHGEEFVQNHPFKFEDLHFVHYTQTFEVKRTTAAPDPSKQFENQAS